MELERSMGLVQTDLVSEFVAWNIASWSRLGGDYRLEEDRLQVNLLSVSKQRV